ncbi:MAG: hypothetical protein WCF65_05020 [Parachlamydiaceae bacterium]
MDEKDLKIEKIEKVGQLDRKSSVGEDVNIERMPPNKEHFDALINNVNQQSQQKAAVVEANTTVTKTSIMDEVRLLNQRVDRFGKVNPKDLVAQANDAVNKIKIIKEKLAGAVDLNLKPETQTLLQNKLLHIDENLRVVMSKAGVEYAPSDHLQNKSVNPIERFLGFLTKSQAGLASLSGEVESMQQNHKEITPANMLRVQLKMGFITNEIEFFTAVLNKALDSTKTIMNVQV